MQFVDDTPGQTIQHLIRNGTSQIVQAVGIDRQALWNLDGLEWAVACEYFGNYETAWRELSRLRESFSNPDKRLSQIAADVSSKDLATKLALAPANGQADWNRTIIHASVMLHQLHQTQRMQTLHNVERILQTGDMLLELSFVNASNYYAEFNLESAVCFRHEGNAFTQISMVGLEQSLLRKGDTWYGF